MLKKCIYNFIIAFTALFFLTILVEIGFFLREKANIHQLFFKDRFPHKPIKILFINDSILGFSENPNSMVNHIVFNLNKLFKQTVEFKEISSPGLNSEVAKRNLNKIVNNFKPTFTVLLFGKADYYKEPHFFNFKLLRLFEIGFFKIRIKLKNFLNSKNIKSLFNEAWRANNTRGCEISIPLFENALQYIDINKIRKTYPHADNHKAIRALHACYYKEGKYNRGISFFTKLKESSSHFELIEQLIKVLVTQASIENNEIPLAFSRDILHDPPNRFEVKTNMWILWKQKKHFQMKQEFSRLPEPAGDKLSPRTVQNFIEIVTRLEQTGSKILVLQYPLDFISSLKSQLNLDLANIYFVGIRDFLDKIDSHDFSLSWDEDMEHLSAFGSRLTGKWIADKILEILNLNEETN